ncbi:hypothetical protein T484DRAFT_1741365 [Baffinella frigidus]|nr:hypothetical protein T484DRAFT_1741365 [Cryptophyta sp. CCMP2293]
MDLRDYHGHRSRQSVLFSLHPTMRPTPEEMEPTLSSCPQLERSMLLLSLKLRLWSSHSVSSFLGAPIDSSSCPGVDNVDDVVNVLRDNTEKEALWARRRSGQQTSKTKFPPLQRPDIATSPARPQRSLSPARTSQPPALAEFERPGGINDMKHIMLTLKKEELAKRGGTSGVRAVGSVRRVALTERRFSVL